MGGAGHTVVDEDTDTAGEAEEHEEDEKEDSKAGTKEIQEKVNQFVPLSIYLDCLHLTTVFQTETREPVRQELV